MTDAILSNAEIYNDSQILILKTFSKMFLLTLEYLHEAKQFRNTTGIR